MDTDILTDRNAELAVLGAVMNGETPPDLLPDDFSNPDIRTCYEAVLTRLADHAPVSVILLDQDTNNVLTDTLLAANGLGYLRAYLKHHADIIRESSIRRRAASLAAQFYRDVTNKASDLTAVMDAFRRALADMETAGRQEWESSRQLADATLTWLERLSRGEITSVQTGITDLDNLIGGLYPGEMNVVGARPGVGKTVFGMVAALNASKAGRRVGVVNLEMLDSQYGTRIVSNLGRVDAMKLRRGVLDNADWGSVVAAVIELSKLPAAFLFTTRHIEDIVAAARNHKGLDLLVVDYLQLVRTKQPFESERLRMAYISWALKELAVDLKIPVVVMSQLRRAEPGADNKMPSIHDLRECGNIEADADNIVLLHEPTTSGDPYVYKDDKASLEGWKEQGLRYICMKVAKQRQGQIGTVPVLFDAAHMRYLGIERGQKDRR